MNKLTIDGVSRESLENWRNALDSCQKELWSAGGISVVYAQGAQEIIAEMDTVLNAPVVEQQVPVVEYGKTPDCKACELAENNDYPYCNVCSVKLRPYINNKKTATFTCRDIKMQRHGGHPLLDSPAGRCFVTSLLTIIAYHESPDLSNLRHVLRNAMTDTSPLLPIVSSLPVLDHAKIPLDERPPEEPPSTALIPPVRFRCRTSPDAHGTD